MMTAAEPDDRPARFPWPPVLLITLLGCAVAIDAWLVPLPIPFAESLLVMVFGAVAMVTGAVMVAWTTLWFIRHGTSIRPDRGATILMTTGPFAYSRNPIYLGEVLLVAGAALAFNRATLLVAAIAFANLVSRLAIVPEEAHLERRFGDAYIDYRERVGRWL